jgi:general secretion pathway protein G
VTKHATTRDERGFTLIELLIVVVVLGVLAAIVLFASGNAKGDAETAAGAASTHLCKTAQERYKAENGTDGDLGKYFKGGVAPEGCTPDSDTSGGGTGGTGGPGGGDGGGATTTSTSTSTTLPPPPSTTTTTTVPPAALSLSCSAQRSGFPFSRDYISCSGSGADRNQTVTMTVCRTSSFPCTSVEDTMTDRSSSGGSFNASSDSVDDGRTYYVQAKQGSKASPVVSVRVS